MTNEEITPIRELLAELNPEGLHTRPILVVKSDAGDEGEYVSGKLYREHVEALLEERDRLRRAIRRHGREIHETWCSHDGCTLGCKFGKDTLGVADWDAEPEEE